MNSPIIYLAGPYTDDELIKMERRAEALTKAAAEISNYGLAVFSPITHGHEMAKAHDMPKSWEFWEQIDSAFLAVATELWVLMLPGYIESRGVQAEIKLATKLGIPIKYVQPVALYFAAVDYAGRHDLDLREVA